MVIFWIPRTTFIFSIALPSASARTRIIAVKHIPFLFSPHNPSVPTSMIIRFVPWLTFLSVFSLDYSCRSKRSIRRRIMIATQLCSLYT